MPLVMIKSDPRAREKPCLRCGHSLRKIDATHCPDCGLSVWLSLNSNDGLDGSRPEWLRRMAVALWVMAPAQLLALPVFALSVVAWLNPQSVSGDAMSVVTRIAGLCAAAYLVLYHANLLILTAPER